jgi:hypothetical protein
MTDPIEQLKQLVKARAKATAGPWRRHPTAFGGGCVTSPSLDIALTEGHEKTIPDANFIALAGSLDLPAILAAWEADRVKIENAWHELRNLLDRNMPQDSLASAIAYMIDHSNTGWQRVCGWEKLGKAKDALLAEKDTRIARLEAVVKAL